MRLSWIVLLGTLSLAANAEYFGQGSSTQLGTGFSIGPSGIGLSAPGFDFNRGAALKSDGQGRFELRFSLTGNPLGATRSGTAPAILPAAVAPPPTSLTDSNTFFRSVGESVPPSRAPVSRRPQAP